MDVAIIGGGALGLAAAYDLCLKGHKPEVFEVAPFLGGQASTFEVGGGLLEKGYHHLFKSDTDIVDLIHQLGLGPKLRWIESKVGLFHGDRIWNFASPKDLLTFTPLSLMDRIRLGLVTLYLQKTKNWQRFEGVTALEWLQKRVGRRPYEVIWEPMLRGKFGRHYEKISMAWLWGKIYLRVASRERIWEKEKLGYPMGSFAEIFDALDREIKRMGGDVRLSTGVRRVIVEDGKGRGAGGSDSRRAAGVKALRRHNRNNALLRVHPPRPHAAGSLQAEPEQRYLSLGRAGHSGFGPAPHR